VEEMVKMIAAMRAYEANSKVIQVTDASLDKLVNNVGNA
jgi:flagellar basal body rod protein FlgG